MERRLLEHNELSENSFTFIHRPWKVMASFPVGTSRGLALKMAKLLRLNDRYGGEVNEFPPYLQIREYPALATKYISKQHKYSL